MKKKIYSTLAISSALLILLSGCGTDSKEVSDSGGEIEQIKTDTSGEKEKRSFGIGEEAPDFKLESLDGEVYRLEDMKGKAVFINFFGVNCPYCIEEMPDINKLYLENRETAEVLLVNAGDPKDQVEKLRTELGIEVPMLLDEKFTVGRDYMMQYVPYTVIIDSEGVINMIKVGPMSYEEMQTQLDLASK
jgi:peroxiredoxin